MSLILELSSYYSIVLSAAVAITYTLLGGLYSVAYTDVIQLFFIFLSLVRKAEAGGSLPTAIADPNMATVLHVGAKRSLMFFCSRSSGCVFPSSSSTRPLLMSHTQLNQ
jgi:hypothetical protein